MNKDRLKSISTLLVFVVFLLLTGKLLRYVLNDDTSSYTRVTFHEMYEQENIDILFLGSSHSMHSFDPALLDKELGMNTFNASTSSQALDGSYMILKEAAKYNDIKHVYLDLFFNSIHDVHKGRNQMTNTYIISDYLRPSIGKCIYLLKASRSEHYANSFIVARRCWRKIFEPAYIADLIRKKNTEAYRNFEYEYVTHEDSGYAGKGYIKNLRQVKDWDFFDNWGWTPSAPDELSQDYKNDLIKIIEFCKAHDIDLTLVSSPTSDFCLTAVGDYDEYLKWIHSIADPYGIEYYDFSLCKEEYFPSASYVYVDPVHLNEKGAGILAKTFSVLVKNERTYDDIFYESYHEKLKELDAEVFGVSYMNEYDDNGIVSKNCRIITNAPDLLEYRISVQSESGKPSLLRDYSSDTGFSLEQDISGTLTIEYRNIGNEKSIHGIRSLSID